MNICLLRRNFTVSFYELNCKRKFEHIFDIVFSIDTIEYAIFKKPPPRDIMATDNLRGKRRKLKCRHNELCFISEAPDCSGQSRGLAGRGMARFTFIKI